MRVLVACEFSGVVRDAFLARGHEAISCDLLPSESRIGAHMQCDVLDIINTGTWDLMIAHPPCTYLTCAAEWAYSDGPYHQKVKPGTLVGEARRLARDESLRFFMALLSCPIPRIAIENPVGVIASRTYIKPTQTFNPYDFGDDASKRTCLWLKGLPPLVIDPAKRKSGRMVEWPRGAGRMVERWSNQTDSGQNNCSPSDDRWSKRSVTYQGIADAMAEQWA
jgi:hypothetical protein